MLFKWFNKKERQSEILKDIFPESLLEELNIIENTLDFKSEPRIYKPFGVLINGTKLTISQRTYLDIKQLKKIKKLSPIQQDISYCFFSRHHDGYVREKCLKKIIDSDNYFVIPFVIQLLGEYVIEILDFIYQNRAKINKENLLKYINENPDHYYLTRQRIYSYWDCNYRKFYPKYGRGVTYRGKCHLEYPGIKMLKYIDRLVSSQDSD